MFSQGKAVSAWLSEDGNYYDGQANSLERGFRRYPTIAVTGSAPVSTRIAVIPFWQVRPHEGTDFSAGYAHHGDR